MTSQHVGIAVDDGARMPKGFMAAGVHCGVKPKGADLAVFTSDAPAVVAGVFTTNRVQAPCVRLCRERLGGGLARAIVMNSGNANACTGEAGRRDAEAMAEAVAREIGVPAEQVFMSSTGPIGVPLPMDRIEAGIREAISGLSVRGGEAAAAMMTTDTEPKHVTTEVTADGCPIRVTGVAKGSGMIHPGMATMLAYLFTDAAVDAAALQACLAHAVGLSFNRITVDGDRSTNDTVLMLANGLAGNQPLHPGHPDWGPFDAAVQAVSLALARRIVRDGEGATRLVTVQVDGAASDADADRAARAVGNSLLVKTSWAGGDPNWGRVLCAVGYSGADFEENRVDIDFNGTPAVREGTAADTPAHVLREIAALDTYTIGIHLHRGAGHALLYASDTTEAYVRINVEE